MVMAHNFVPHHHHSEFAVCANQNKKEHHHEHHYAEEHHQNHSTEYTEEVCCVEHRHTGHDHTFCSFDDEIIRSKQQTLPSVYDLPGCVEITFSEKTKQQFADNYLFPYVPGFQCRDVLRRGPPLFS